MRKFKKNYELELMILRTFLKHVKEHHLYHRFRCSVGLRNRRKDLFHVIASRALTNYNAICKLGDMGSYYMNADSLEDILAAMRRTHGGKLNIENNSNCQMSLMNIVNGLVHSCIEYSITNDFHILEKIGEATFNEVCRNLFGDKFEDKTKEGMNPKQLEMMEKFGRLMPPPDMFERRRRGDYRMPTNEEEKAFQMWLHEYMSLKRDLEEIPEHGMEYNPPITPQMFYEDDDDFENLWD